MLTIYVKFIKIAIDEFVSKKFKRKVADKNFLKKLPFLSTLP